MIARKRQKPEYTELEYIEGTGTQYIDTGYMINHLNKIEFKIQDLILPTTVSESFFGAGDTATNNIIALYLDHNHQCLGYRINSNGYNDTQIGDTDKLSGTPTVTIDNGNIVLNNRNNEYSYNYKNIQCYTNRNCYIFARNQGDRIIPKSKVKLCYFKIWDNNALIRDFIPVLDKNNVPCLYDLINKEFYYNQGTGEFLYKEKSELPNQYQQVDYIESTGIQYIDTNYLISSENIQINLEYLINKNNKSDAWTCIVGVQPNNINRGLTIQSYINDITLSAGNKGGLDGVIIPYDTNVKYNIVAKANNNTISVTINNKDSDSVCFENSMIQTDHTYYIFAKNTNNRPVTSSFISAKLYYLQIYDDDHMVKNFIPCYRKSDGEIGLYDTVTKQFFTNQGTGTFLKGVDV